MALHDLYTGQSLEVLSLGRKPDADMVFIPGGTFRMGLDEHYPEEAPVHRVTVDAFAMDRTPVTNRQFKEFVKATGHVTFAEIPPDPKDYPGALPHMIYAGSLVFSPPPRWPTPNGPARNCRPRPNGNSPRAAGSTAPSLPGVMS